MAEWQSGNEVLSVFKRRATKISQMGEWDGPGLPKGGGLPVSGKDLDELKALRERLVAAEAAGEYGGKGKGNPERGKQNAELGEGADAGRMKIGPRGVIRTDTGGLETRPPSNLSSRTLWLGWAGWVWVLVVGIIAAVVVQRFDARINEWMKPVRDGLGGDVRREWAALQQFGQGSSIVIVCVLVWCLDVGRRRRLWDYVIAMVVTAAAVTGLKMLIGRPRPRFEDPQTFLGPLGMYPVPSEVAVKGAAAGGEPVLQHAWETGAWRHAQLWSMPSSHTALAFVMAMFLWVMYPRIKWLGVGLAALVAVGRLVFDAHWASDVVMGACVGCAAGVGVIGRKA